jgi:hypothetical protein
MRRPGIWRPQVYSRRNGRRDPPARLVASRFSRGFQKQVTIGDAVIFLTTPLSAGGDEEHPDHAARR